MIAIVRKSNAIICHLFYQRFTILNLGFSDKNFSKDVLHKISQPCSQFLYASCTVFCVNSVIYDPLKEYEDKYAELEAESKNCKFDEIEQFRMKAQAFAYRYGVKRDTTKKETHIRMGFDTTAGKDESCSVFAKIMKK